MIIVEENAVATEPDAPAKDGFTFEGWYLDGNLYDFNTPVTGGITLIAQRAEASKPATQVEVTAADY